MYALSTTFRNEHSVHVCVCFCALRSIFLSLDKKETLSVWIELDMDLGPITMPLYCIALHCIAHIIVGRCRTVCQNQVHLLSPFNSDSQQIFKFSADIWITCYRWNVACIAKLSNVFSTANASLLVVDFVFKFFFFLHLLPFPLFLSKHLFSFTFILFFINVCHYTILSWLCFFCAISLERHAIHKTRSDIELNIW